MITYNGNPVVIVAAYKNTLTSPKVTTPLTVECEFVDQSGNPIYGVRHVLVLSTELAESEPGDLDLALAGHTPTYDDGQPSTLFLGED
jgi:hypothetical protein